MASQPAPAPPNPRPRPVAPHLGIWKWSPAMLVSILHRATGSGMATVGAGLLVWWLAALASGEEAYATFRDVFTRADGGLNVIGWVIGVGLTWSLFQHMGSGLRHLVMDTGAAFELKVNRALAIATMIVSAALTIAYWFYVGMK